MPTLMISALQHMAYCPRQFALIHVEQAWSENHFTAEGQLLHQRVDAGEPEQRGSLRTERSVRVESRQYAIRGIIDLLEISQSDIPSYCPVEYKRGKPKTEHWDRIQLCAQALCLEEMHNAVIEQGAIWYWQVRRREQVQFDHSLREVTLSTISAARQILQGGQTPSPIDDPTRCRACSLTDICLPEAFRRDHTASYIREMLDL